MRQFICIFSAFALLIGCVKIDPTTTTGQESEAVIAFESPIVAAKVKSVAEFKSYPDTLNFRVWGYYSESNEHILSNSLTMYMNGAEFSKQGDTWASVGKNYYWPKNGYLDFVAYAPAKLQVALTETKPTFQKINEQDYVQFGKYTVPDKADEDLLISDVSYYRTKPEVEDAGDPLMFHHVLSSVVFKVNSAIYGNRDDVDPNRVDTDLRVTKIEILQARARGILNVNLRKKKKSCTTFNDEKTLKKDFTGYNSDPDKGTGAGTVLTDGFQFCHDMQIAPEKEGTHSLTNLILLPQKLLDDVVLRVTYDMTTSTMSEANGTNEEVWIKDQVKTIKMNECGVSEWKVGTRYIYNISLGLNKIQCSAEVSEWTTTEVTTDVEDLDVEDVVEL